MDSGIADTLNRQTAALIASTLDENDIDLGFENPAPWYRAPVAATFMGESDATNADRAWLTGRVLGRLKPETYPADGDWEMLFGAIRAEILARRDRDPKTPHADAAEVQTGGVV